MAWEIVIGLETHTQLTTASKIFSGASTAFGAEPNSQASVIDVALPGTLPVLNRAAVERAIRFGLAVGATIAPRSVFARKNYFYPDLPKGYQISQYEIPVVQGGSLSFKVQPKSGPAYMKTVRLTRAHLEEDAGKSLHEDFHGMSGIDLNRAGTPLLEIVSEPDIRVPDIAGAATEAVAYAKALYERVVWNGICDGNMQEGSFRCDANVSVRPLGSVELGTRCEIKNLNSFRFMQQAIEFEARRQIELLEDGGTVVQETRLYDPDRDETRSMRSKEDAMDYRYFPDPDLLPLEISPQWMDRVRGELSEQPDAVRERFVHEYGLSEYDAQTLTDSRLKAAYYEATARQVADKKLTANWIMGEVSSALNSAGRDFGGCPVSPGYLAGILNSVLNGETNANGAKRLFAERFASGGSASDISVPLTGQEILAIQGEIRTIIDVHGLGQISDARAIEAIVDQVLAANPKSVEEFRAGKEKAFNALVGQAMKATKGKANPAQVNEILRRRLAS